MSSSEDQYSKVESLVDELLDLPVERRASELRELEERDSELFESVERLIRADGMLEASEFMSEPFAPALPEPSAHPTLIDRFRILEELGSGGMGTVFLAEQHEPVQRRVALKLTHGFQSDRDRERFATEAQALARMRHPNIASFYDSGTSEDGTPYVAMELVEDSTTILDWCDERQATLDERIALFVQVCAGVSHAHEKGLLHRDLKPANVLVTEVDGQPTAKVIDFGVSRAVDSDEERPSARDYLAGSPIYMSPEAVAFNDGGDADTRSDVYALGLLLCELVTGDLPFDHDSSLEALMTRMRERIVTRPSERLRQLPDDRREEIARRRGLSASRHLGGIAGDLDAIVLKATAYDRDERYPSPRDLALDLERHRRGEPIAARPSEWGYVLGRFLWKRKGWVAASMAVFTALAIGFVARSLEADRAQRAARLAEESAAEAAQIADFLQDLFSIADPRRQADSPTTVMELLDESADRLQVELVDQPHVRASLLLRLSQVNSNMGRTEIAERLAEQALAIAEIHGDDPLLADIANSLGIIKKDLQKGEEAEPLLRQSIEIHRMLGPDYLHEAATAHLNLGSLFAEQGDVERARIETEAAVEIWNEHPELDRTGLPIALVNLSGMVDDQARAFELNGQAYRAALESYGPEHVVVGQILMNRGMIAEDLGRWDAAERDFRQAYEILAERFDRDHPALALSRVNLGMIAYKRGNWSDAVDHCLGADATFAAREGPTHRRGWALLWKAARALIYEGRLDEATAIFQEYRRRADSEEPRVDRVKTLAALEALLLIERARFSEAEAQARSALDYFLEEPTVRQPEHTLVVLGRASAARREDAEALVWLDQAAAIARTHRPDDHTLGDALELAASVAARLGQRDRARDALAEALVHRERTLGAEHAMTVRVRALLTAL